MSLIREVAIERMQRDHEKMLTLIDRIKATCTQLETPESCKACQPVQQQLCHANVEQLIRSFVEVTLKHNLMESLYMEESVPAAHRSAHNLAHIAIAEQLKSIRIVLSEDRNSVLAIAGIDGVLDRLHEHIREFDAQLEAYLLAPA